MLNNFDGWIMFMLLYICGFWFNGMICIVINEVFGVGICKYFFFYGDYMFVVLFFKWILDVFDN